MADRGQRLAIAGFLALFPGLLFLVLVALGKQDHAACLDQAALPFWPSLAAGAALLVHPVGFIGLVPFLSLAGVFLARSNGRLTGLLWLGLLVLLFLILWPPAFQHDCDRKGTTGEMALLLIVLPGLVANWIAMWRSRPLTGAK